MSLITSAFAQYQDLIVRDDTFTFQGSGRPYSFRGNVLSNDDGNNRRVTQFKIGGI